MPLPSFALPLLLSIISGPLLAKSLPSSSSLPAVPPPSPSIPAAFAHCFDQFPQMALSNAIPSAEFFNVSPEDCLRFCTRDPSCHTMVHHRHFSTCQLYSGAKEGEGAKEVGAKGHDMYGRRKGGECGGGGKEEEAADDGPKKDQKKEEEEKRAKGQ